MPEALESIELIWIGNFIGENWQSFIGFMEESGQTEAEAEELANKIERLSGQK